ncbi:hypothetical protein BIV25_09840 [Streptomyces sp. MUSC 14]|nr:hypothetical protein BIV25_09840 [Streptomyces sp. MUSC 14]
MQRPASRCEGSVGRRADGVEAVGLRCARQGCVGDEPVDGLGVREGSADVVRTGDHEYREPVARIMATSCRPGRCARSRAPGAAPLRPW